MLDLDLDLEADLGVDTVKQAEMFAAIREIYNIPRDENRKLRDYPTLAHVIRFVYEKRPDLAGAVVPAPAIGQPSVAEPASTASTSAEPTPPASIEVPVASPTADSIKDKVLEIVAEKTGYPRDMLDLDLDLEADLGIDTVNRLRCSRRFGRRTTSRAMRTLSCVNSRRWRTLSNSHKAGSERRGQVHLHLRPRQPSLRGRR